jgi:transposase-like protein
MDHALWLLNRFNLNLRVVQELLQRGTQVSYETLREYQRIHGFLWNTQFAHSIQLGSYQAALGERFALENVKHMFEKSAARLNNRIERDHEHVREKQRASLG